MLFLWSLLLHLYSLGLQQSGDSCFSRRPHFVNRTILSKNASLNIYLNYKQRDPRLSDYFSKIPVNICLFVFLPLFFSETGNLTELNYLRYGRQLTRQIIENCSAAGNVDMWIKKYYKTQGYKRAFADKTE